MSKSDNEISTEKLSKRKKLGIILIWIMYGVACFNLGILGYKYGSGLFTSSNIVPMVFIPAMMGMILSLGLGKINKELDGRDD
jgi:hypothetical protein